VKLRLQHQMQSQCSCRHFAHPAARRREPLCVVHARWRPLSGGHVLQQLQGRQGDWLIASTDTLLYAARFLAAVEATAATRIESVPATTAMAMAAMAMVVLLVTLCAAVGTVMVILMVILMMVILMVMLMEVETLDANVHEELVAMERVATWVTTAGD